MREGGIGQWAARFGISCALAIGLSTFAVLGDSRAQSSRDLRPGLAEFLQGQRVFPTALGDVDRARRRAAEKEAPRPLGAVELPPEGGIPRAMRSTFTEQELLQVEEFCRGEMSEEDERSLRVLKKFSGLERDYCTRAREPLLQFGYEHFDAVITPEVLVSGVIPEDYVLGIGDEIVITFRGQQSRTHSVFVDREGRVIIENMVPIPAAGRTFADFRRELEARTATAFLGTDVFVSVGSVRLVSAAVFGEVYKPGLHRLTGLSTILDAIGIAGGVKKTGSLRRIQINRGDRVFWIDMYELMISGGAVHDLALFDGDRIFVPAIGPTAAIAGQVKRPGIYELAEGRSSLTISDMLGFGGGPLRPRGNSYYHVSFAEDGRERITEELDPGAIVTDGDIIIVHRREDVQVGAVELMGHVRVPGLRSLASAPTVRALVAGVDRLRDDPYLLLAVLQTTDPATRARRMFPVNLQRILSNQEDFSLRDNDRLIVLGAEDVRYLSSTDVQDILLGIPVVGLAVTEESVAAAKRQKLKRDLEVEKVRLQAVGLQQAPTRPEAQILVSEEFEEACRGLRALAAIIAGGETGRFPVAVRILNKEDELSFDDRLPCPRLFDEFVDLLPFLLEHVVAVNGEVRRPGVYPVIDGTAISSLIAVMGGVTREADLAHVELTHLPRESAQPNAALVRTQIDLRSQKGARAAIDPGDFLRFNRVFTDREQGPVLLQGEFIRPGPYQISRGERLSEVIARAGGLTAQAYPYGAVFTRERVKEAQQQGFRRAARELDAGLASQAALAEIDAETLLALRQISRQLESVEAVGRVVTEADPTVLQLRPDLDTVLEPGDRLFMPKRPNFVTVTGDILNPGALQFASGKRADDYIDQAGGFQRSADDDRIFVVFPNGEAQPLSTSVWNYSPVQIPPGSTIVVPKDPAPFDLFQFALDLSGLLSQVAITAASLAVINQ